jgi:hypothetical protein
MAQHDGSASPVAWGSGIAIGLAIGIAMGTALENIGVGIALGMGIGVAFGIAFSEAEKRRRPGEDAAGDPGPTGQGVADPPNDADAADGPAARNRPDEEPPGEPGRGGVSG